VLPTALAIAGLDPSGGAGLAADLRSFQAAGVWGAAVCATLTVQSSRGLRAVRPVAAALVVDQAREVLADGCVRAIKTGALGSAANARAVAALLAERPDIASVVDPVMLPSRGAAVGLHGARVGPLRAVLAVATLVTPNLDEASALLGAPVTEADAPEAAAALVAAGAQAALVKGGHGTGADAIDWLALRGGRLVRIARKRRRRLAVHGTGCTLASLIAGRLAAVRPAGATRPDDVVEAARWARARLDRALATPLVVGAGQRVIDVRWRRSSPPGGRGRRG
jgi:hydroxymethylpyrimidine/phosphomethylpyrimidine kinase